MSVKLPILTYHSIDNSGSVISTSIEQFRYQIQYLQDKQFNLISLNKIVKCIRENVPLPPKSVAITFDDGFKNFYSIAYPILKRHGFTATVFLVPGYCGKNNKWLGQPNGIPDLDLLDWKEIREMSDSGIDFGAHTMAHADLSKLSIREARQEIVNSKLVIQKHLERDVLFFAYPYGKFSNDTKFIIRDEFYGACSTRLIFVSQESDIYALPRIDMYYFSNNNFFSWLGSPIFNYYVKIRNRLRLLKRGMI